MRAFQGRKHSRPGTMFMSEDARLRSLQSTVCCPTQKLAATICCIAAFAVGRASHDTSCIKVPDAAASCRDTMRRCAAVTPSLSDSPRWAQSPRAAGSGRSDVAGGFSAVHGWAHSVSSDAVDAFRVSNCSVDQSGKIAGVEAPEPVSACAKTHADTDSARLGSLQEAQEAVPR